jgi:hypothetical protein
VWTTASVRQARVINPTASFEQPAREGGPYAQVSRLGMILVNEVVIGLPDKDRFNVTRSRAAYGRRPASLVRDAMGERRSANAETGPVEEIPECSSLDRR